LFGAEGSLALNEVFSLAFLLPAQVLGLDGGQLASRFHLFFDANFLGNGQNVNNG